MLLLKKYFFKKEVKYMRVVIKVGTSTLAYENTGLLHIRRMKQLCEVLSDIKNAGHEVIQYQVVPLGWAWENWDWIQSRMIFQENKLVQPLDNVN